MENAMPGSRFSKRFMLLVLLGLCFMMGVRMAVAQLHLVDFILVWVIAIIMIYLCIRDARQNGREIVPIYRTIMFFLWPWSIGFYYIRFHGWKGLVQVMLWGFVFLITYAAGGIAAVIAFDLE